MKAKRFIAAVAVGLALACTSAGASAASVITTLTMGGSVVWTLGQSGPAGLEVGDTVGLELQVTNDTPTAGSFSYGSTIADATSGSFYHGDGFWWDRVGGTLFFAPTEAVDQVSFEIRFNKWDGYNSARDGSFVSALLALDAASNNGDARGYGYVVEFIEAYCYHYLDKAKIRWHDFSVTQRIDRVSQVPLPAAAWLFLSGLLGLMAAGRRRAGGMTVSRG
jgi:hypothetical protein